ncbi:MAG: 30S ribosome-binding factor RbfA [Candidatus Azambacteria bacterium]|nr:30S ribosome-binding factor RbfA [Candidatus Azambacteria bacterium]
MTEIRVQRFNELIKQELGKIIFDFLDVKPGILVTVTRVITAPDLFSVVVFISSYPDSETNEIFNKLNRSIYQIQQLLNKKLKIRPVPKIIFKRDKNPEEASEIEKLISEIKEK